MPDLYEDFGTTDRPMNTNFWMTRRIGKRLYRVALSDFAELKSMDIVFTLGKDGSVSITSCEVDDLDPNRIGMS